ncbi:MAG TPA: hypothetical protein VG456_24615, partial [Candidatus Sulfopaludibacter sp.]|nr:hypothetical protein [Candidatus Sulfopaludibacter sp.]
DNTEPLDGRFMEFEGDQALAEQWLNQFRWDEGLWVRLRLCFNLPFREEDDAILQLTASRLARGIWRARRPVWIVLPFSQAAEEAAAPFPLDERPAPRPAAPAPMMDQPDFPDDADLYAIARSQRLAAELGIPFCEECAKAAAAGH